MVQEFQSQFIPKTHILNILDFCLGDLTAGVSQLLVCGVWVVQKSVDFGRSWKIMEDGWILEDQTESEDPLEKNRSGLSPGHIC